MKKILTILLPLFIYSCAVVTPATAEYSNNYIYEICTKKIFNEIPQLIHKGNGGIFHNEENLSISFLVKKYTGDVFVVKCIVYKNDKRIDIIRIYNDD